VVEPKHINPEHEKKTKDGSFSNTWNSGVTKIKMRSPAIKRAPKSIKEVRGGKGRSNPTK